MGHDAPPDVHPLPPTPALPTLSVGKLSAEGTVGGLKLDVVDLSVCEDVSRDDIFRFVTEALTLSSAEARCFSVGPSDDDRQLKQMRMAG